MSLITLIRDYVDVANSSEQLNGYTLSSLAYYTFTFFFTVVKETIIYFLTFHWLRDLSYFCLTPPNAWEPLSAFTNGLLHQGLNNETRLYDHQPFSNLLAFSDSNFSTSFGIVSLGFVNGCVSCLHISAANLVTVQRMLVRGVPAGICSALGTAAGQFSFFMCVLFGFRGFLFPWLSFEPIHFLLGTIILLGIASSAAQDRRTPTIQWSATSSLLICALTSFALAWCEQTAFFQWIGNISLGTEPTFLETTPSPETVNTILGTFQQIAQNSIYLVAFLLGNIAGACVLGYTVQRLLETILRYKGIAIYYGLVKQANLPLATLIFAFGFGALPYYGFDFFITKGFGFDPHEHLFQQTLFSPVNLVSKTSQAKEPSQGRLEDQLALLFTLEGERTKSLAIDTTPFDDGQYLKVGQKRPQAFEDLNYRGEHLWTNRLSRISNMREQANQTQSSFLGPVFSWMRSFLWGDATGITEMPTSANKTINTFRNDTNNSQKGTPQMQGVTGLMDEFPTANAKNTKNNLSTEEGFGKDFSVPKVEQWVSQKSGSPSSFGLQTQHVHPSDVKKMQKGQQEIMLGSIRQKREFSSEREQIDNYAKEFDHQFDKGFSNFSNADPYSLIEVEDQWQEKKIKEKCYTNPIYTFLLNTEIDAFLKRQPNLHWLSPQEEVLLLKRRQLLSNYYDTLALTSQVSTSESLSQLVPKSYSNTIYNHQFKGTLKVARRLFSVKKGLALSDASQSPFMHTNKEESGNNALITPASTSKEAFTSRNEQTLLSPVSQLQKETRTIKFDQPLFLKELKESHGDEKTTEQPFKILFHEELNQNVEPHRQNSSLMPQWSQNSTDKRRSTETNASKRGIERNTPEKGFDSIPKVAKHQENVKDVHSLRSRQELELPISRAQQGAKLNIFLLEQAEPLPLYASWDNDLRKLLLTNRFQSRTLAGYTFSEPRLFSTENKNRTSLKEGKKESEISTFFTTWPIPQPLIARSFDNNSIVKDKNNVAYALLPKDAQNSKDVRETQEPSELTNLTNKGKISKTNSSLVEKPINLLQNFADSSIKSFFSHNPQNRFLFLGSSGKHTEYLPRVNESVTNDMVNALLQWQKLVKENKQLSKEDKQIAKENISYWPENINRSNWSNEAIDNDLEFEEPAENVSKKQTLLWEFTPPNHGGFLWPGSKTMK